MNRFQYILITLLFNLYCALAENATVSAEAEGGQCGGGCVLTIFLIIIIVCGCGWACSRAC